MQYRNFRGVKEKKDCNFVFCIPMYMPYWE